MRWMEMRMMNFLKENGKNDDDGGSELDTVNIRTDVTINESDFKVLYKILKII